MIFQVQIKTLRAISRDSWKSVRCLLGWFTDDLIGSSKEIQNAIFILKKAITMIPEGDAGLILISEEPEKHLFIK